LQEIIDWGLAGVLKELNKVKKRLRRKTIYGRLKEIRVISQVAGETWWVRRGESFSPSLNECEGGKVFPKRKRVKEDIFLRDSFDI